MTAEKVLTVIAAVDRDRFARRPRSALPTKATIDGATPMMVRTLLSGVSLTSTVMSCSASGIQC